MATARAARGFPWLDHRSMAQVGDTESLLDASAHRLLTPRDRQYLQWLLLRAYAAGSDPRNAA